MSLMGYRIWPFQADDAPCKNRCGRLKNPSVQWHECQAYVKIYSSSPVMVMSSYEWILQSGEKKQKRFFVLNFLNQRNKILVLIHWSHMTVDCYFWTQNFSGSSGYRGVVRRVYCLVKTVRILQGLYFC